MNGQIGFSFALWKWKRQSAGEGFLRSTRFSKQTKTLSPPGPPGIGVLQPGHSPEVGFRVWSNRSLVPMSTQACTRKPALPQRSPSVRTKVRRSSSSRTMSSQRSPRRHDVIYGPGETGYVPGVPLRLEF